MLDILDSSTLSIVVGIMWAISLLLMFSIWRINRNVPGLSWWLAASAMSVIGFLFGIQTFHALGWPVAYGYVVNNALSMTAGLFILSGTLRFRGIAPLPRAWMALPVLFACGAFWLRDQTNWRYLFMDSIGIILLLASAWGMLRGVRPHERLIHALVAAFLLLFALALAGRLVMYFGVHDAALLTRQGYQKLILLGVVIFAVGWSYGISLACYLREHHALLSLLSEDALTGLYNRRHFVAALTEELERSQRTGSAFGICMIDLNGFKGVNDTYGHKMGDALLVEVARRLRQGVRSVDLPARLGGDEFAVLIRDLADKQACVLRRIRETLNGHTMVGDVLIKVHGSLGMAVWPEDGHSIEELLDVADSRMYDDKRTGEI